MTVRASHVARAAPEAAATNRRLYVTGSQVSDPSIRTIYVARIPRR